ncbi:hypothetical protein D3C72_778300 [compost metagenome]
MQSSREHFSPSRLRAEDIVVSRGMIEVGLAVLEETDDRPLSRLTVERAFREMCLRGLQESAAWSPDLIAPQDQE